MCSSVFGVLILLVRPDVRNPILRAKLAKGIGHNSYGEIAWPNDLLYMFPVCIVAVFGISIAGAVILPTEIREAAELFDTPLEILPEWFLLPTFELLRALPNKVLGIASMAAVPIGLASIPFVENINPFANPLRRPISLFIFVVGYVSAIGLGTLSLLPV